MTHAAEIRRHLLKARLEIEDAEEHIQTQGGPDDLRRDIVDLQTKCRIAEGRAALWAES